MGAITSIVSRIKRLGGSRTHRYESTTPLRRIQHTDLDVCRGQRAVALDHTDDLDARVLPEALEMLGNEVRDLSAKRAGVLSRKIP